MITKSVLYEQRTWPSLALEHLYISILDIFFVYLINQKIRWKCGADAKKELIKVLTLSILCLSFGGGQEQIVE